ncbi:MAG: hypothetical protein ACNA8H_09620 [Anaerolineales bacterium]
MDAMREQFNKPAVIGLAGFVVGVFIGLVVLGWWLWPVKWVDAGPEHLRTEFKEIYLRMAIDSYAVNPDPAFAWQRMNEIEPDLDLVLANIIDNPQSQNPEAVQAFVSIAAGEQVGVVIPPEPEEQPSRTFLQTLLPFLCLVTFLLAGGLVAAFLLRNRVSDFKLPSFRGRTSTSSEEVEADYGELEQAPPLAQFMTTYNLGNDLYDDSFSIDSQAGEFLGECGVGISETIGVGEPKRVIAFEVWLFDKNDIQTVTQILMSEHAFADEATLNRLEAKGEPIVAEPGRELVLETATLQLSARVIDMSYGSGALPPESYFERVTLELVVWPKA